MAHALVAALLAVSALAAAPFPVLAQGYSLERAKAYAAANDWKGLEAYAEGWTRTAPNEPDAWYALARAYGSRQHQVGLQRPADALPAYRRAVSLRPEWPEAWYALGMTAAEVGRWDESIEAIGTAAKQAPGRVNYWLSLAGSYSHQRRPEEAVQSLAHAERLAATAQDWLQLGNSYYAVASGNAHSPSLQRAEAAYRRCIQIDGRIGRAWTNLGTAEEGQGKLDAALKDYQQGAALGDSEGRRHHARLTAAIAANEAARRSAGASRTTPPTTVYECAHLSPADRQAWSATCSAIERRQR